MTCKYHDCTSLTSLHISASVTLIDRSAFSNCSGLTNITVDPENQKYTSQDENGKECNAIIEKETGTLWKGSLATTIPETVTRIGDYAFSYYNIETINIPDNIKVIGNSAFYSCKQLSTVTLPASVTEIGYGAFEECASLVSVSPDNSSAPVKEAHFPQRRANDINNEGAFIPETATEIGEKMFAYCNSLPSIVVDVNNAVYTSRGTVNGEAETECNAIIEKTSHKLVQACNSTVIPSDVVVIGTSAFQGCNNVGSVTLPAGITGIEPYAFESCSNLTSVVSLVQVPFAFGENAFGNIPSVCVLIVPDGAKDAYLEAGWTQDVFQGGVYEENKAPLFAEIGDYHYKLQNGEASLIRNDNNNYFGEIVIPSSVSYNGTDYPVTRIDEYAFCNFQDITSVTIPSSVTTIGEGAFIGCWQASFIVKWDNPISISSYTFNRGVTVYVPHGTINSYNNDEVWNTLTLQESLEPHDDIDPIDGIYYILDENAHTAEVTYGGTKYEGKVVIPSTISVDNTDYTVTRIGDNAFKGCSKLTHVTIPTSIDSLGSYAFYDCQNLCLVTVNWTDSNDIPVLAGNVFNFTWPSPSLKVAKETLSYYLDNDTYGRGWWNSFEVTEETYVNGLFYFLDTYQHTASVIRNGSYRLLTEVVIPSTITVENQEYSVTEISSYSFRDFENLTSVTIPEGVTSICESAFIRTGITGITIPKTVTSIDGNLFESCRALESIVVESGNTVYDSRNNCNAIIQKETNTLISACQNTTIPSDIKHIGDNAFRGSNVATVEIPQGVESIGRYAFMECSNLETVVIPSSIISIGERAFASCDNMTSVTVKIVNPIELPTEEGYEWYWDETNQEYVEDLVYYEVFSDAIYDKAILSVPATSVAAYENAPYWSKFSNIEKMPNFYLTDSEGNPTSEILSSGDDVTLLDTYRSLVIETDIEGMNEITYQRIYPYSAWLPWYVPFDLSLTSDVLENFSFAKFCGTYTHEDEYGEDVFYISVIKMKDGDVVKANTPYLVYAKNTSSEPQVISVSDAILKKTEEKGFSMYSAEKKVSFQGIYSPKTATEQDSDWYFINQTGYVHASAGQTLGSYRFFITITDREDNPYGSTPSPNHVKMIVLDDEETDIADVINANGKDDAIYDLSGRIVTSGILESGIYIINGKKVYVK